jgi:hypothetical protein
MAIIPFMLAPRNEKDAMRGSQQQGRVRPMVPLRVPAAIVHQSNNETVVTRKPTCAAGIVGLLVRVIRRKRVTARSSPSLAALLAIVETGRHRR